MFMLEHEVKKPGEYTTTIDFDNNSRILVDTKEGEEIDFLISNLKFISDEYDLWSEGKKEITNNKREGDLDYDYL